MDWIEELPRGKHLGPFGGQEWELGMGGIGLSGAAPVGTPGPPSTALRVWRFFSIEIRAAATAYNVPVECIIATIAVETAGDGRDYGGCCYARREEPGFVSDAETPDKVSLGPMQVLLSTAREVLAEPGLTTEDLQIPSRAIRAGAAFIASRRSQTKFDPPLVAAAYNAGGLYYEPEASNPWRLRCWPLGTGGYISRWVEWFNDAMRLTVAPAWPQGAPSFAVEFVAGGDNGAGSVPGAGQGIAPPESESQR